MEGAEYQYWLSTAFVLSPVWSCSAARSVGKLPGSEGWEPPRLTGKWQRAQTSGADARNPSADAIDPGGTVAAAEPPKAA